MVLTEATIRNAVRRDKPYKLTDERGLFLFIKPNGAKWGRFRYRFGRKQKLKKGQNTEKEKTLSCGVYPEVSLKEARERRDDFRALLRKGIDPAAQRAADKLATGDTVSVVVNEYLQKLETPPKDGSKARRLSAVTIDKGRSFLERFFCPCSARVPLDPLPRPVCARGNGAEKCGVSPWSPAEPPATSRRICTAPSHCELGRWARVRPACRREH
jgi:hypothetical protein